MKRFIISAAISVLPISLMAQQSASAQLFGGGIVYDPANHTQNILTAVRSLQEINQQIQQLTHEIEMLENMARNLETLDLNVAHAIIRDRIRRLHDLMRQAAELKARNLAMPELVKLSIARDMTFEDLPPDLQGKVTAAREAANPKEGPASIASNLLAQYRSNRSGKP